MNSVSNNNTIVAPGLIRPLYFRDGEKYLFGCHHLPSVQSKCSGAVVLCHASGNEYYYSHRAMRQLATRLARAGFHCLRFDYSGTGDSAGSDASATLAQWKLDVTHAIDELKRLSRIDKVSVIGLRLGASLAWQSIVEHDVIGDLVLWNPVLTGADLLEQWSTIQSKHNQLLGYDSETPELTEVMGITLSPTLLDEIRVLEMQPLHRKEGRILVLDNLNNEAINTFTADAETKGTNISQKIIEDPEVWQQSGEGIVPSASINIILQWLSDEHD